MWGEPAQFSTDPANTVHTFALPWSNGRRAVLRSEPIRLRHCGHRCQSESKSTSSTTSLKAKGVMRIRDGNTGRCQLRQLPHVALFRITDPAVVTLPWPDNAWAAPVPGVRQGYGGPDGDGEDGGLTPCPIPVRLPSHSWERLRQCPSVLSRWSRLFTSMGCSVRSGRWPCLTAAASV